MNSSILYGQTRHCRYLPRRHAFQYRMVWLCVDLDELPYLNREVALLGYNRAAVFSLLDADYGGPGAGSMRQKLESLLVRHGVSEPIGRIMLITLPRVLRYAFNPVSFFICYGPDGRLAALISEVRNTVGEAHHYVLQPDSAGAGGEEAVRFRCPKTFYVSPFLQVRGEYEVLFTKRGQSISLEIHLRQGQQLIFSANMSGDATPLNTRSMASSAISLPWIVATVMSRISWQALWMYLQKKLPVYANPERTSAATYRPGRFGAWHRFRTKVIQLASQRSSALHAGVLAAIRKDNPS